MTDTRFALDQFFSSVQFRAFRQAELATGCREDALDIVQDAMMRLAQKYSEQRDNWPMLFQRILQNAIRDWYRRKKVKSLLFWLNKDSTDDDDEQEDEQYADSEKVNPLEQVLDQQINDKVFKAIQSLPLRQQQAFVLRAWWEYDTRDTAAAMECTEGSIKTHYSRAIKKLSELLANDDL
jgi:RNA polymerase sigma-70 factor, ECF subfamily